MQCELVRPTSFPSVVFCRHGLVHMDVSPDNIVLDKEFVSQQEVRGPSSFDPVVDLLLACCCRGWLQRSVFGANVNVQAS